MTLISKLRLCIRILFHRYADGEPYVEVSLRDISEPAERKRFMKEMAFYCMTTAAMIDQDLSTPEGNPEGHKGSWNSIVNVGSLML